MTKAEIQYHDGASSAHSFRYGAWAVAEGRKLIAWCMTEEAAKLLCHAHNAARGDKAERLRLDAAILDGIAKVEGEMP